MDICEVQCPSCFEWFSFIMPPEGESEGQNLDYDCEVCCRPMLISIENGTAHAISLDEC
ncbi:Cysteine-rich CPXCG [Rubritalea squalenifaciens DSM 18772]|uniref:Cysteine-rich CPXCG n=1 Tax=Rubritalea squalenifaciens DSM 18772 TaxID=1123071 RepID=A0A1M6HR39_9BACT|nr:Cysteine-rich CPXCG [Rubritalea squalenifaciens DSM 18772]